MKLFPRNQSEFFTLFQSQNEKLREISSLFLAFAKEFRDFETYAQKAEKIEHEVDATTHDLIEMLNRLFITPFDREDIYLLTHELDDIVDLIEGVIRNIHLYGITKKMTFLEEFAHLSKEASVQLEKMFEQLQIMKYTPELTETKIRIHNLEDAGDAFFDEAIKELFASETDPVTLLKTKDILEGVEAIMDKYQKISNVIEGIIVKST